MKTSVIRYRVADFLKQYPPFDLLAADEVLKLAAAGRVLFHESGEYVFRQGQPRMNLLWVIQQGQVNLVEEGEEAPVLRDMLGPGDLLGLAAVLSGSFYRYSAVTMTDVILYSVDAGAFVEAVGRHPGGALFLGVNFDGAVSFSNAAGADSERQEISWLDAAPPPAARLRKRLVLCPPDAPLADAARLLSSSGADVAVVAGDPPRPLGLLTARALADLVAAGAPKLKAGPPPPTVPPEFTTRSAFLEMIRGRCQALVVTADGTGASAPSGLLTSADLALACGRNPALHVLDLQEAATPGEAAEARARAAAFIAEGLAGPSVIEWFSQFSLELDRVIFEKALAWTEARRRDACWVLCGSSARADTPAPALPQFLAILPGGGKQEVDACGRIAAQLDEALLASGYLAPPAPESPPAARCRTLSSWRDFFARRIADPIGSAIYEARSLFDLRFVAGDPSLLASLRSAIASALASSEAVLPVLANDTMGNMPPLSFFHGVAVEIDGARRNALDLDAAALRPLAGAARVFALALGDLESPGTARRLAAAARAMPLYRSVFDEAASAFRVVACHHALSSLGRAGGTIYPSALSRYEQALLKKAFQSIQSFLEFTDFNSETLGRL